MDARQEISCDLDIAFLVASLSKAFISALCGISVEEGKLA